MKNSFGDLGVFLLFDTKHPLSNKIGANNLKHDISPHRGRVIYPNKYKQKNDNLRFIIFL